MFIKVYCRLVMLRRDDMRIAALNLNTNFGGIQKKVEDRTYDDHAQEVTVTDVKYEYYPFADEQTEEIEKVKQELTKVEYDPMPYPTWSTYYESRVKVMPPLSITQAQYEALRKQKISDNFIIKTFA